jgi:hypothetical protein
MLPILQNFENFPQKSLVLHQRDSAGTLNVLLCRKEKRYTLREPPFLCGRRSGGAGEQLGQGFQNFRQVTRSGGRGNGAAQGKTMIKAGKDMGNFGL